MPKTFSEIRDDLKSLKDEIYTAGEGVDTKLLATYVDRLVQTLEDLTDSLETMEASVDCACECCESCEMPAQPKAKAKPKAKPKKAKPAKKRKR